MLTTAISYSPIAAEPVPAPESTIERHGYQPSASSRVFGGIGTIAICSLIVVGFFVVLDRFDLPPAVLPPLTVSLLPMPSEQRPQPKAAKRPKPRKTVVRPEPRAIEPIPKPIVALPTLASPVASPPRIAVDPAPQATAVAPPPSPPAAPAPAVQAQASHGPDKWAGRVLARVEYVLRYPDDAKHARQQGTAYVRFRIDRNGHVLSATLDRSSGYSALDDAALDTVRRADPLPKIPPDRPDEVELTVPVVFSLHE